MKPEDWQGEVDCNECYGFQPDSANLIVYVTISPEQDSVPLTFYRGDSMGEIDWQDTATTNYFTWIAEVGSHLYRQSRVPLWCRIQSLLLTPIR